MTVAEHLAWTKAAMEEIRMNEALGGGGGLKALGEGGSSGRKEDEKAKCP